MGGWVLREAHIHATQHNQAEKHTRESHVSHEIESYTDRGRHMTAGPSGEMGDTCELGSDAMMGHGR